MEPTIEDTAVFFVNKTEWRKSMLKRGDVVIATSPVEKETQICKRVVHMQHDSFFADRLGQDVVIPQNQVWVEGDNKGNSYDSRHHGPIDKWLVKGVAICKIYPNFKWL